MAVNPYDIGKSPSLKLGAKYLSDDQLRNTFPEWESLLARIEEQREFSAYAESNKFSPAENLPQMYDNVYGILGGRGTGKSSVLLTLRKKITSAHPQDIVLPIVTPEVISDDAGSILGWLMAAVERVVGQVENDLKTFNPAFAHHVDQRWIDDYFDDCHLKRENPLRQQYNDLFKLSVRSFDCAEISGYSVEDTIYYKVQRSREQFRLIQELNRFWKRLARDGARASQLRRAMTEGNYAAPQGDQQQSSMIVISFDDIDLVPERSLELLSTTFQYLDAPNVVIILTAAEKVLKRVIQIKMLDRLTASNANSSLADLMQQKQHASIFDFDPGDSARMRDEFYNKVIPPSRRYYLKKFSTIQDMKGYLYSSTEQCFSADGQNRAIPITDMLIDQVDQLREILSKSNPECYGEKENFLVEKATETVRGSFKEAYLLIFGEKNRNIANACLAIINTVSQLRQIIGLLQGGWQLDAHSSPLVLVVLRQLLSALLESDQAIQDFCQDDVRQLITLDRASSKIRINYALVWKTYQHSIPSVEKNCDIEHTAEEREQLLRQQMEQEAELRKRHKRCASRVMVMLFFVENLLILMEPKRRKLDGGRELALLINSDAVSPDIPNFKEGKIRLVPLTLDADTFLTTGAPLLEHIDEYVFADFYDPLVAQRFLINSLGSHQDESAIRIRLNRAISEDPNWCRTMLALLYICFSDVTNLSPKMLCISAEKQHFLDQLACGQEINQHLKEAAREFAAEPDMTSSAIVRVSSFFDEIRSSRNTQEFLAYLKEIQPRFFDWEDIQGRQISLETRFLMMKHTSPFLFTYRYCIPSDMWETNGFGEEEKIWSGTSSHAKLLRHAHQIQDFYLQLFEEIYANICCYMRQTGTLKTTEELLLPTIREINPVGTPLNSKKKALILDISTAINRCEEEMDEDSCDSAIVDISAERYLSFLADVEKILGDEDPYGFFTSNGQSHSTLLQLVHLVDSHDTTFRGQISSGEGWVFPPDMPVTSQVTLLLRMLEFFSDEYISACLLIRQEENRQEMALWPEKPLDKSTALGAVFTSLPPIAPHDKTDGKKEKNIRLRRLMYQVQQELIGIYLSRPEARND